MNDVIEVLKALAAILGAAAWPVAAILIARMFRKEIVEALGRLKKGKFLGQEVELAEELDEAASKANAAASEVAVAQQHGTPSASGGVVGDSKPVTVETDKFIHDLLQDVTRFPKGGLLALGAAIESEFRKLLASRGHNAEAALPIRQAVRA